MRYSYNKNGHLTVLTTTPLHCKFTQSSDYRKTVSGYCKVLLLIRGWHRERQGGVWWSPLCVLLFVTEYTKYTKVSVSRFYDIVLQTPSRIETCTLVVHPVGERGWSTVKDNLSFEHVVSRLGKTVRRNDDLKTLKWRKRLTVVTLWMFCVLQIVREEHHRRKDREGRRRLSRVVTVPLLNLGKRKTQTELTDLLCTDPWNFGDVNDSGGGDVHSVFRFSCSSNPKTTQNKNNEVLWFQGRVSTL